MGNGPDFTLHEPSVKVVHHHNTFAKHKPEMYMLGKCFSFQQVHSDSVPDHVNSAEGT